MPRRRVHAIAARVAVDAARYQADEEEVLFAIAELESALDELLSDVPARLAR